MNERRNTDMGVPPRLYSKDRNDNSGIGKGAMHPRRQSDSFINMSDIQSLHDGKMSRFSMLNESRA